jgi:hypothetical protein
MAKTDIVGVVQDVPVNQIGENPEPNPVSAVHPGPEVHTLGFVVQNAGIECGNSRLPA